jgi:hypothetical protein
MGYRLRHHRSVLSEIVGLHLCELSLSSRVCALMGHGCALSWVVVCQGLHPRHPGPVLSSEGVVGVDHRQYRNGAFAWVMGVHVASSRALVDCHGSAPLWVCRPSSWSA